MCNQILLGGVIGDETWRLSYIRKLVKAWKSNLESLTLFAETESQAVFSSLTNSKSLQFQWNYVQGVVSGYQSLIDELESVIFEEFFPAVFGREVSSLERETVFSPARMGGLGVFKTNECRLTALRSPPRLSSMWSEANKCLRLIPTLVDCWRLRQMSWLKKKEPE